MNIDEIRKVVAKLCLAALVSGAGLALLASCGSKQGTGGTDPQKQQAGKSG